MLSQGQRDKEHCSPPAEERAPVLVLELLRMLRGLPGRDNSLPFSVVTSSPATRRKWIARIGTALKTLSMPLESSWQGLPNNMLCTEAVDREGGKCQRICGPKGSYVSYSYHTRIISYLICGDYAYAHG